MGRRGGRGVRNHVKEGLEGSLMDGYVRRYVNV